MQFITWRGSQEKTNRAKTRDKDPANCLSFRRYVWDSFWTLLPGFPRRLPRIVQKMAAYNMVITNRGRRVQRKKLMYTRYDMGITVINWQTMVELGDFGRFSWLYQPNIGTKLSSVATTQHPVTTSQECFCFTVRLYLQGRAAKANGGRKAKGRGSWQLNDLILPQYSGKKCH